jgi:hypothetical protein
MRARAMRSSRRSRLKPFSGVLGLVRRLMLCCCNWWHAKGQSLVTKGAQLGLGPTGWPYTKGVLLWPCMSGPVCHWLVRNLIKVTGMWHVDVALCCAACAGYRLWRGMLTWRSLLQLVVLIGSRPLSGVLQTPVDELASPGPGGWLTATSFNLKLAVPNSLLEGCGCKVGTAYSKVTSKKAHTSTGLCKLHPMSTLC